MPRLGHLVDAEAGNSLSIRQSYLRWGMMGNMADGWDGNKDMIIE